LHLAFRSRFANVVHQIAEKQREAQLVGEWKVDQCEQRPMEEVKQWLGNLDFTKSSRLTLEQASYIRFATSETMPL
jgi:hypothetical protein